MFHAIALVPLYATSTTPHNIRVGGFKKEESARKALDKWCATHNIKFGYVQQYGATRPVYIKGV